LARTLGGRLERPGRRVRVLDGLMPRAEFLEAINQARVSLFLPNPTEGFFLPALEAMALGSVVVCPDVVGNRSFCTDGVNCFRPEYEEEALLGATEAALGLADAEREDLLAAASEMAARHDLPGERAAFHEVLDHLDDLYENG
jgi:glycosyltransferase involved in cell wall biosynthesis